MTGGWSWVGEDGAEWLSEWVESVSLRGLERKDGGLSEGEAFTGG